MSLVIIVVLSLGVIALLLGAGWLFAPDKYLAEKFAIAAAAITALTIAIVVVWGLIDLANPPPMTDQENQAKMECMPSGGVWSERDKACYTVDAYNAKFG